MQGDQAPFTDALMRLAQGHGWDALDEQQLAADEQTERALDMQRRLADARLVADVLTTPAGHLFLTEWLAPRTLLATDDDERAARTAEEMALAAARRQGRNDLVREMLRAIRFAASGGTDEG